MKATHAQTGDLVQARPWHKGRELAADQGIVLDESGAYCGGEYIMVWFPGRGPMEGAYRGNTFQPILREKAELNVRRGWGENVIMLAPEQVISYYVSALHAVRRKVPEAQGLYDLLHQRIRGALTRS